MKKIFTLLFTAASITAAVAQTHQPSYSRTDSHFDNKRGEASYSFTARERDEQIAKINMDFNAEIRKVKFDRFVKQSKKNKQISKLELQRSQQIAAVNARFADRRNRFSTYAFGRH